MPTMPNTHPDVLILFYGRSPVENPLTMTQPNRLFWRQQTSSSWSAQPIEVTRQTMFLADPRSHGTIRYERTAIGTHSEGALPLSGGPVWSPTDHVGSTLTLSTVSAAGKEVIIGTFTVRR